MARKRACEKEQASASAPTAKRGRKVVQPVQESTVQTPKKRKTLGVNKKVRKEPIASGSDTPRCRKYSQPETPTRVSPRGKKLDEPVGTPKPPKGKVGRPSKKSKKVVVTTEQDVNDDDSNREAAHGQDVDAILDAESECNTSSQKVKRVKNKIRKILEDAGPFEEGWVKHRDDGCGGKEMLQVDSDDDVSQEDLDEVFNNSQLTMSAGRNYVKHPILDCSSQFEENIDVDGDVESAVDSQESQEVESQDGDGDNDGKEAGNFEEGEEGGGYNLDISTLQMVPDNIHFGDETKAMEEWWLDDPSRERTLCKLWQEERSLYDMNAQGYRVPGTRAVILRRFSTILMVPRKYIIKCLMTN